MRTYMGFKNRLDFMENAHCLVCLLTVKLRTFSIAVFCRWTGNQGRVCVDSEISLSEDLRSPKAQS